MNTILRNLSLVLFVLPLSFFANAQSESFIYDGGLTIKSINEFYSLQGDTKAFLKLNDIEGSPHLDNEFTPGYIITNNGYKFEDIPLRYNIYNDEIEFTKQDQVLALDKALNYPEITIGKLVFIYSPIANSSANAKSKSSYFNVLNSKNKLLLLKRFNVKFIKPVASKAYGEAKPATFKRTSDRYYLKFGTAVAHEVGKIKTTLALFGDKSKEVAIYIKSEKLKLRKEADLLKIVAFYNSL